MKRREIISKGFNNDIFVCLITFPNGKSLISNIKYIGYDWYEEQNDYNAYFIDFDMFNYAFSDNENIKSYLVNHKIISFINHFYKSCNNYPLYFIQGDYGIVIVSVKPLIASPKKLKKFKNFFKKHNLHYYLIYQQGNAPIWSF